MKSAAGKHRLRIALAAINPTVGDLAGNSAEVARAAAAAAAEGAHLIVFPEMVLTGYPIEDLALRSSFRAASKVAIDELAQNLEDQGFGDLVAIVGYLDEAPSGGPQNVAAVIHRGQVCARYIKTHLPNFGVFDEYRNFVPGDSTLVVRIHGVDVGVLICQDIWHPDGVLAELAKRSPGLVVVPNGSPFERNKDDVRLALVSKEALRMDAPFVYVNMVGGQDDLVFDGDSMVVDRTGALLARTPHCDEGVMIVDLDCDSQTSSPDVIISEDAIAQSTPIVSAIAERTSIEEEIWKVLVTGLRDYVEKNGFRSVVLGLSGGIDSALVAAIAVDALGAKRVNGVALPSKYSSDHSLEDAAQLAQNTGLHFRTIPIAPMVDAFTSNVVLKGLAEENVQARVRGTTLMGISNQEGHLVLATGNKSELAVGYSTLYGDAVGGYAPIKDIYKTDVWALSRWRNARAIELGEVPPIPVSSIEKEPSAELRPDQKDSDSLPDYRILDEVLTEYVDHDRGYEELVAAGFDSALVARVISLVDMAEYKRRQYPPGTKVSSRAFGKDRRLPMTTRWREGNEGK
jgi:NAD+ synthase (glutamine-hydrolysing)